MARRMAMSDADVIRLLKGDPREYIDYPPERGDLHFEEEEIDEDLAQMIMEQGFHQEKMEELARQNLAEMDRSTQGEYMPNQKYQALKQALEDRLVQQGVGEVVASLIARRLYEFA